MLIGSEVYIKDMGIRGTVIDESKNTLIIDVNGALKRIIKDENRFVVYMGKKEIKIRGEDINLRPWEYAV